MDYYNILGVDKTASQEQIKKAYRKLSLQFHPDKKTGNAEKFKQINEAYQILGDGDKKKMYDQQKEGPMPGEFPSQFFNGNPNNMNHMAHNMQDNLFKMFFGHAQQPFHGGMDIPNVQMFRNGIPVDMSKFHKPPPIIKTIHIDLKSAYTGINMPIEIERWVMVNNTKQFEKEKMYVPIPPGIDENEIIIMKGKGNYKNETLKGDVKIFIKIKNNSELERDGLNLIYKKDLTLRESLLGFTFSINHISGKTFNLVNDPGKVITPGFKKVATGMGMERDNMKGDMIIYFNVIFPKNISKEQVEKLKNIL